MEFNFTKAHYDFFEKELNTTSDMIDKMSESELDDFYEKVLDIELEETPNNNEKLSKRGATAIEIVNIMVDALGYVQDDEWEAFLNEDDETPAPQRAVV